jgi:hypothetical protein
MSKNRCDPAVKKIEHAIIHPLQAIRNSYYRVEFILR